MFLRLPLMMLSFFEVLICSFLAYFIRIFPAQQDFSNSILVIRLDNKIGDMVIFSDFIRKVHESYSDKKIFLMVHASQKALYVNCPYVQDVYFYDWGKSLLWSLPLRSFRALFFLIKNRLIGNWAIAITSRYDEDFHAPFLLRLTNAVVRVGFTSKLGSRKSCSMFFTDCFYTISVKSSEPLHESKRNLLILDALKVELLDNEVFYETWCDAAEREKINILFSKLGVDGSKVGLSLGIGAYANKRIWPSKYFADLIMLLGENGYDNLNIFLLGSAADARLANEIKGLIHKKYTPTIYDLTGLTSLGMLGEVLNKSRLFIGNDSGLLHLACSTPVKVMEISCHPLNGDLAHPNSPLRFGPIGSTSIVMQPKTSLPPCGDFCSNASAHCILGVKPADVFNKAVTLLKSNP